MDESVEAIYRWWYNDVMLFVLDDVLLVQCIQEMRFGVEETIDFLRTSGSGRNDKICILLIV